MAAAQRYRVPEPERKVRMRKITLVGILFFFFSMMNCSEANEKMNILSVKEQSIAVVAAYAAKGDQAGLKDALASGLDAGVTINEFKEILVQVYAYSGFPRSLNALNTFMELLEERGGRDAVGKFSAPLPSGRSLEMGTENQTKLIGAPAKGAVYEFAPIIDTFLKAHLFGDIFSRDNLDWKTREIATIAMLAAMKGTESQRNSHIAIGIHNGLTEKQTLAILSLVETEVNGMANTSPFPLGKENTEFSRYFSGKSYLEPLTKDKGLGVPVFNVTFEPGCRNNWHSHSGGQLLIAVGGVGYYQQRGKPSLRLLPGHVVEIPPDVEHWHGAAPDCWFSHLAVECNPQINRNVWLEPVSDEEYQAAVSVK